MLVEVADDSDGMSPVGRGRDVVARLPETFAAGLDRVQVFTDELLDRFRTQRRRPDRITVEFGLKFSAKSGIVVAEASGEANLKFVAEWARDSLAEQARAEESESKEDAPSAVDGQPD
ncbi:CU044_2847 family protein [Nonomuraea endophytica]|uniref:CU044_2847 family protein n=1 Tax=Nonomuraea endophytica TaxID=714136 RepID=UPI0037C50E59